MNYSENANQKTFLEELPNINSIKQKYIRNDITALPDTGDVVSSNDMSFDNPYATYSQPTPPPMMMTRLPDLQQQRELSCREVAAHVMSCDICRSFYNMNVTPYIVTIVVLILIVLFLIKNILQLK